MGLRIKFFGLVLSGLAFAQEAKKPAPSAEKAAVLDTDTRMVIRSISERYRALKAWRARFSQETFSTGLGKGNFSAGEFTFVPPNKFRYSIVNPDPSDFISNGREAWQIQYRKGRDNGLAWAATAAVLAAAAIAAFGNATEEEG